MLQKTSFDPKTGKRLLFDPLLEAKGWRTEEIEVPDRRPLKAMSAKVKSKAPAVEPPQRPVLSMDMGQAIPIPGPNQMRKRVTECGDKKELIALAAEHYGLKIAPNSKMQNVRAQILAQIDAGDSLPGAAILNNTAVEAEQPQTQAETTPEA